MDNLSLNAVNTGRDNLLAALRLCGHNFAVGYKIVENKFCPMWAASQDYTKLPFQMNMDQMADLLIGWLETEALYEEGFEGDSDMTYKKGWEITTQPLNNDWRMICVVEPRWAIFSK
jgi:hypothetical protein